jgi:phosphopantothenoylcysteine decarboxylase/phosphopantothenate--cysteine ligase
MGFALARAARDAGAQVTLVAGPVELDGPRGVQRINVRSAQDMDAACHAQAEHADVFIATAAVADWRPTSSQPQKIKKQGDGQVPSLAFVENPDILSAIAASERARSGALYCVGFAAESQDLEAQAKTKRLRKGVPLLVANIGPATFGQDDNALLLIDAQGTLEMPRNSKLALGRMLVAEIANRLPALAAA